MSVLLDIVIDNSAGDSGKGKVVHHLLKSGKYNRVIRGNAGNNAGHTIYHEGKKFITHLIPAGVFWGIKSYIGPGCLVHPKSFLEEIQYLEDNGLKCRDLVKIASNAHIVTDAHIEEDSKDTKIGTTKRGIGPAAVDRYNRIGIQAKEIPELKNFIVDFYSELFDCQDKLYFLYEGAQGFELDIFHGDYPYVTSSHTTVAGALLNGFSHKSIKTVFSCIKAFATYVGNKKFQPEGEIFNQIREIGQEYGATTQRPRQCNFLNVSDVMKSLNINDPDVLIINKMDVLQQLDCWKIIEDSQVLDLKTEEQFRNYLKDKFKSVPDIRFSYSAEYI